MPAHEDDDASGEPGALPASPASRGALDEASEEGGAGPASTTAGGGAASADGALAGSWALQAVAERNAPRHARTEEPR
jgi:hypothetical protein